MSQFKNTPEQARKLWCELLRSGEFPQRQHKMRRMDGLGHCCLDIARIACERAEGVKFPLAPEDLNLRQFTRVQEWLGLESPTGSYNFNESLEKNNDSGKNFHEIASIIESAPPGLFVDENKT